MRDVRTLLLAASIAAVGLNTSAGVTAFDDPMRELHSDDHVARPPLAESRAMLGNSFAAGAELVFERNQGQHAPSVRYVARGSAYSVVLDELGAALVFPSSDSDAPGPNARLTFTGSSGAVFIEPLDRLDSVSHFISDKVARTDVPNYARVAYRAVYPGIDAIFRASASQDLEIDFAIAPRAEPDAIGFSVDGNWNVTPQGDVTICTSAGEVVLRRPAAFQTIHGQRITVDASYARDGADGVRLRVGTYDRAYPLIIDPAVSYATAISKVRTVNDIAVDSQQNVYVVGSSADSTFTTTPGAYQPTYTGTEDAVIIKYNKSGQRIFATFLGGVDVIDRAMAVAVDDVQDIYVAGRTSVGYDSQTGTVRFPVTAGAYQSYPYVASPQLVSDDVFVAKLNSIGSTLLFSSLVAGSGYQDPVGIALGPPPARNVYVAGVVTGPPNDPQYKQFPTTSGAYRSVISGDPTAFGNDEGFVFALSNTGSTLVASTLFGGRKGDEPKALAVDKNGDVWITGYTYSFDFPKTANAYRRWFVGPTVSCGTGCTSSAGDAFVLKFNASMTQLLYGTFLPGSSPDVSDVGLDVTTDPDNNAYVVGYTPSDDFPTTPGAYKTANHGGFITKFNAAGQVQFSTVLGGATPSSSQTQITGVRTSGDVVFVSGFTSATDFATKGPIQATNGGGTDMFFCVLNGTGNFLEFFTYLGGNGYDSTYSLDMDAASNLYVTGTTGSTNFPFGPNPAEPAGTGSNTFWLKVSSDRDEDGLLDWWELSGIDANGDGTIDLDLPALGAKVDHKDLFVEVDYMTAALHTHDPRRLPDGTAMASSGIAPVVAAFANAPVSNPDGVTGIALHVLLDESIPEQTPITTQIATSDFNLIKLGSPPSPCSTAHFGTVADRSDMNCENIIKAKRRVYRYCLFAHNYREHMWSSGIAERGGNDLVVSLAAGDPGIFDYGDLAALQATRFGTSLESEWRDMIAGAFMHELGHTLALQHGGGLGLLAASSRDDNCKPNYLSVMNYSRTFNEVGTAPGTTAPLIRIGRSLDYSRAVLPTLAESQLVEGNGVGGPSGVSVLYGEGTAGTARVGAANGAIDWDGQNGIDTSPVSADINRIATIPKCSSASPGDILFGHDDWSNLVYNFRVSPDYANGTSMPLGSPEADESDVSGGVLGTVPPLVTLTAPQNEARFDLGVTITIGATATDPDGSIASVAFLADETLLATQTTAPYAYDWSNATAGTHILRALATDNLGAVAAQQVTVHVGCTATFMPSSGSVAFDAESGTVQLSIADGCSWTATSDSPWLTVDPTGGSGSATITYVMSQNTVTAARSATITVAGQNFIVTQGVAPAFGAPTGVVATGTGSGTPRIAVSWHGTSGVSSYEVAFSSNGTTFTTAGTTVEPFFDITTGVTTNTAYLVKVRALDASGTPSSYSAPDLASTFVYTDDPLQIGVTSAKAVHWSELRTAIDAIRQLAGLSGANWDATIAPGEVITTAATAELRTALDQAQAALSLPTLTYTDDPLTTSTPIRAVHIMEVRAGSQ